MAPKAKNSGLALLVMHSTSQRRSIEYSIKATQWKTDCYNITTNSTSATTTNQLPTIIQSTTSQTKTTATKSTTIQSTYQPTTTATSYPTTTLQTTSKKTTTTTKTTVAIATPVTTTKTNFSNLMDNDDFWGDIDNVDI